MILLKLRYWILIVTVSGTNTYMYVGVYFYFKLLEKLEFSLKNKTTVSISLAQWNVAIIGMKINDNCATCKF